MITAHTGQRRAPRVGGDRPQVMVMIDYDKLRKQAAGAGLIGDGEPISAGDLRRLSCDADLLPAVLGGPSAVLDADLLPAVLGGPSAVLDVGRAAWLVTPEIRAALALRDGGCVFPAPTPAPPPAKPTTSSPGGAAARPPWGTSSCSATTTTPWSNPRSTAPATNRKSRSQPTDYPKPLHRGDSSPPPTPTPRQTPEGPRPRSPRIPTRRGSGHVRWLTREAAG